MIMIRQLIISQPSLISALRSSRSRNPGVVPLKAGKKKAASVLVSQCCVLHGLWRLQHKCWCCCWVIVPLRTSKPTQSVIENWLICSKAFAIREIVVTRSAMLKANERVSLSERSRVWHRWSKSGSLRHGEPRIFWCAQGCCSLGRALQLIKPLDSCYRLREESGGGKIYIK